MRYHVQLILGVYTKKDITLHFEPFKINLLSLHQVWNASRSDCKARLCAVPLYCWLCRLEVSLINYVGRICRPVTM